MTPRKSRTLLRTVRIDQQLDSLLQRDAKAKKLSLNALVNTILTKYAEWNRYMEKFGHICLTRDAFKAILESADGDKLSRIAEQVGTRIPKEVTLFWFKDLNLAAFLSYVSLFCRYGQVAQYEMETEGNNYTITGHHDLGEKWSNFLRHFVEQGMKTTLGITPKIETSPNLVIARFRAL